MPLFGKKKSIKDKERDQKSEFRKAKREIERTRQSLNNDEKKALAEAKKAAKLGHKDVAKIHAKEVVRIRKQRTRSYTAGAQMSSLQNQMKVMEANNRMAKAMGASAKSMGQMNKGMKGMQKEMEKFKEQALIMENTDDLLNDAIDSALGDGPDSDQEVNDVLGKIFGELDLEVGGNMPVLPGHNPALSTASTQPPNLDDSDEENPYDSRR
ncbi:Oidioi.mRNA.OKI2018_I69.PAR.g8767.t1.cds [Oikopleura dioica]|uniref:Oidioi.mRNA.OKI2018_I69.PAR.g8767.t1.cds n=1 Tax=Oikopleura dioica TaxID=34765 RepID=A0ABN7RMU3_OIKDI|nr:Oidioi.mRNA.OKI2018_I69.PAR.g8767.t1.cds [Oikopleura dioica]